MSENNTETNQTAASQSGAASKKRKIIDAHTHIYPEAIAAKACRNLGKFYDFEKNFGFDLEGSGTYENLEAFGDECGVSGFVLLAVATNPMQVEKVNDNLAEVVKYSQSRGYETVGFAGMHQDYEQMEKEVMRCKALGFKGFKLHPDIQGVDIDSEKLLPLYELLEAEGMPIYLHVGDNRAEYRFSEPKKLAKILNKYPKLLAIAAHYGGYSAWEEAKEYLYGNPNVWYDCSSALWAMDAETATKITRECGTEKVLFGTDYPIIRHTKYLELFDRLDLTEEEREDILYNNVKALLYK